MNALAWGAKVSPEFRDKARAIAARIGTEPSSLMACIAFETGRTFSPKARNPGSSATGLIGFMRDTARSLGTSVEALAEMPAEAQLSYVHDYLRPFTGRVAELGDLYMAILYPPAVGKPDDFVVFENATKAYQANAGLDFNHDGVITKRECVSIVEKVLAEGLQVGNRAFEPQQDVPTIPLAEVTPSTGRAPQQPAAPIEERDLSGIPPRVEKEGVMPEESTSVDWSAVAKFGGAIASIFNPAVGIAITALSPLLQETITKTVSKHSDDPKVAQQIGAQLTEAIMTTTKSLTGKVDDLEAVAVMRKDPAIVAAVERAVSTKLDEMAPFLDRLHQISKEEWEATAADRAAAAERAKSDQFDMAAPLLYSSIGGVGFLTVFVAAVILIQIVQGKPVGTELWAALTGLIGWITAKAGTIYDYRFGTSRQSAAKDVLIGELSRR